MKRFRGCLLVAFIFVCGFLAGGFFGAAIGWVGLFHKVATGGPGTLRDVVMERSVHDLNLKPAQKERMRKIVDETSDELADATAEVRPKLEQIMGHGQDEIREILDPKQRQKFDHFAQQVQARWKAAVQALSKPILEKPTPPSSGKSGEAESKDR